MTNSENVALRRKLLEALHTAPQKMETTDKQNSRYQGGEGARHKQNSGPPQGDSLARNEAPPKTGSKLQNQINNRKKPAAGSILDCEQKMQEKYAFSFDHREDKDGSMMSHSSKYGCQKNERKNIPLDSPNKQFPGKEGSDMRLPSHKKETNFACPPSKAKKTIRQKSKGFPKGSSDDTREATESPDTDSPCSMELEAEKYFSQSLMEEKNARSSKGSGKTNKSSGILRQSKRVRIQEDLKPSKINLSSLSPTGTSRTDGTAESREVSEAHLASKSFSQMASVLEGFNTKLKSHTSKKGSEILSSALQKVRLQLQAVDCQIQADLGKLTNVGKSKRRHLESTFQEQHERLRLLHGKFKEEINQQILDCRTTIEELDAYQLEIKGAAERQRATHRKLLIQAEEAMKAQLNDADTCILAVTKEATDKMSGLKLVLDEWIAEGEVC